MPENTASQGSRAAKSPFIKAAAASPEAATGGNESDTSVKARNGRGPFDATAPGSHAATPPPPAKKPDQDTDDEDYGKRVGGAPGTLLDGDGPGALAQWITGTHWADELNVDPESAIGSVLGADAWKAVRKFCRKHDIPMYFGDGDGMAFSDFSALPREVWRTASPQVNLTRGQVAEFAADTITDDPHEVGEELKRKRWQRFRERDRTAKAFKAEKIAPGTAYTLSEVEHGCGPEVANAARRRIEQHNRDTWNMGSSAARKCGRDEQTYLVTAAELYNTHAVAVADIAALAPATEDDRSSAWAELACARARHSKYGTAETIDVAGGMVSPEDMSAKEPPRRMLGHWLYFAQLTELIAQAGGGKTFVALGMGLSLAAGKARQTIGLAAPRRAKVLYVAAEAPESVYLRVLGWCQHHKVAPAELTGWFTVYPGAAQLGDPEHMRQLRRYVNDNGVDLVILDTRHLVTLGLDENSSGEQGVAIGALKDLNADGAATLVVHHTTKDGKVGDGGRGAGAWFAAAYTSLYLKRDDKLGPVLVCDKIKDGNAKCRHPLHYSPVKVSAGLMPNARDDERTTQALTAIDPMAEAGDPREPSPKALNLLLMIAHHAGFKGLTVTEIKKRARTKDDPDTGYDVGSQQTIYDSINVLRDTKGDAAARYLRAVAKSPLSCRVTDEGWDLLVARGLVTAEYAEAHRYTAEDVGTEQFAAACENIAASMTALIKSGDVVASDKQTEPAARRLVESDMAGKEQEFSAAAWAAVYSRWKDDGRPAEVQTAAQANAKKLP